jgi:hypothetical protein
MNKFLKDQKLLNEIAETIYGFGGKQGWQQARCILKLVNESRTHKTEEKLLKRLEKRLKRKKEN